MKGYKVWVDADAPPEIGWVHTKDFQSFADFIHTVKLPNIDLISFGTILDEEPSYHEVPLNACDCATELISTARGGDIPQCVNHTNNTRLQEIINHYVASYKLEKYCANLQV